MQWPSRARNRAGQPYENGCIGVFTVRGGRISSVREYMDTLRADLDALRQAGSPTLCLSDNDCTSSRKDRRRRINPARQVGPS